MYMEMKTKNMLILSPSKGGTQMTQISVPCTSTWQNELVRQREEENRKKEFDALCRFIFRPFLGYHFEQNTLFSVIRLGVEAKFPTFSRKRYVSALKGREDAYDYISLPWNVWALIVQFSILLPTVYYETSSYGMVFDKRSGYRIYDDWDFYDDYNYDDFYDYDYDDDYINDDDEKELRGVDLQKDQTTKRFGCLRKFRPRGSRTGKRTFLMA
jgi:hypothetical protein